MIVVYKNREEVILFEKEQEEKIIDKYFNDPKSIRCGTLNSYSRYGFPASEAIVVLPEEEWKLFASLCKLISSSTVEFDTGCGAALTRRT